MESGFGSSGEMRVQAADGIALGQNPAFGFARGDEQQAHIAVGVAAIRQCGNLVDGGAPWLGAILDRAPAG